MSNSFHNVWIHSVFATKDRAPLITDTIEGDLYACLHHEFSLINCKLKIVNGLPDHVHCLFILNLQRTISEVMKHIKGVSSHYINQLYITDKKFAWQKGYAAFSVSEAALPSVYKYIIEQKTKNLKLEEEGYPF